MSLFDLLFPKHCVGCGKLGSYVCSSCRLAIRPVMPSETICPVCEKPAMDGYTHPRCHTTYALDGLTSFFHYQGPVRSAIKELKYRFVSDLACEFVSLIPDAVFGPLSTMNHEPKTLIPIPLHASRLRFRGFNQAEVLGKLIAERLQIPMRTDILIRQKKTTPQVDMKDREKRLKNMEHVFAVRPSTMNHELSTIFLFDDVFTTGATLRSAASVLKRNGVGFVWGITMAR